MSDPDRGHRLHPGGDVDEDAALPERVPHGHEVRLPDADPGETALDQVGVADRRLLQGGDDHPLGEQRLRVLDGHTSVRAAEDQRRFGEGRGLAALGQLRQLARGSSSCGETVEVELGDVGAPPVLVA